MWVANGSQKRQVSAQKASETERASFPRADEREAPRGELVGHQAGAVGRSRAADQNRVFRKLRNSQQQKKKKYVNIATNANKSRERAHPESAARG